jgi:peroxiredoxin
MLYFWRKETMTTTSTPIAEQVAALNAGAAAQLPTEVISTFRAEQAALDSTDVPDGVLAPGSDMPDGDLLDTDGLPTTLAWTRGSSPAVVVFYRGAWCPYCNVALKTYQEQLVPALAEHGVGLIAISPQKPDGSLSMRDKGKLTFAVLSDPGNQIAGRLGILTTPSEAVRGAQAALGLDVAAVNADGTHTLPMPTVAITDAAGVLRWIDVHPNYTTRTEPAAVLAALASILD